MRMQPDTIKTVIGDSVESVAYGNSLSLGWVLVKMVFFLGLLLILIFALAYVYRKWMKVGIYSGSDEVKEVQNVVLGPGKSVSFLKLFNEIVALYHSGQGVTEIGRWPVEKMEEKIKQLHKGQPFQFKQLLKQKMK